MEKITFIRVFVDYLEAMEPLGDAEKGRLFTSLLTYARTGEAPQLCGNERFLFPMMRAQIDRDNAVAYDLSEKRSKAANAANARKRSKCTQVQQMHASAANACNCTHNNDNNNDNDNNNYSPPDGVPPSPPEHLPASAPKKPRKAAAVRHEYGAYRNVLLSDEDLLKLREEFPDWEARIERLSEYIASSGKSYKNHLATIRAWARKDAEPQGKPAQRPGKRWQTAEEYDRNAPGDLEKAAVRRMMGDG